MSKYNIRSAITFTASMRYFLLAVLSLTACLCFALPATASQSTNPPNAALLFRQAVEDESTAPLYVLVTIVNDNTKQTRRICTGGNFLMGAIHDQFRLPYDAAGMRRGLQIALNSKNRVFHFSNATALKNIAPDYTQVDVAAMEKQTAHYTTQQLYDLAKDAGWGPRQQVTAYILLEHGIACGMGDMTGQLYVVHAPAPQLVVPS